MNQGFQHRLSAATYHADPAPQPSLSNSIAKILLDASPAKAWHSHPRLNQDFRRVEEDKFDIGTAAHSILLEGMDNIVDCEFGDWRKDAAKDMRNAARSQGKTPLLSSQASRVRAMVKAALKFIESSDIASDWQDSDAELTGLAEEDGIWLRMRSDIFSVDRSMIVDYKSTTDVSPEAFSRQIVRMRYHQQDAFYRRVAQLLTGRDPKFVFLAQSTESPYECSLHACDPALREIANAEVERAVAIWRECITKNKWPSYGGGIHFAMPTNYMIQEHEQRLMEAQ